MCRTSRSVPEDAHQCRETPWDEPLDKTTDEWAMTREVEFTKTPEAAIPDTQIDDLLGQHQAWFTQDTEINMREVTSDGDRDLRRSSLLWRLYQRKKAVA